MISFNNKSIQKITIPAKSIPMSLKLQELKDKDYIYSWKITHPKLAKFQYNINKFFILISNIISLVYIFLTVTQFMIARLVESLLKGHRFHLYLDNLFVCWRLCQYLKLWDIALTDIYWKGACGYPPRLLALKSILTSLN